MNALAEIISEAAAYAELARKDLCAFLTLQEYTHLCCMPNREIAGIKRFLFTTAIVVGLDEWGYRTRFCFETKAEAEVALAEWDGTGFPPGWWIKQKPEDVTNPLR